MAQMRDCLNRLPNISVSHRVLQVRGCKQGFSKRLWIQKRIPVYLTSIENYSEHVVAWLGTVGKGFQNGRGNRVHILWN